MAEKYGTIPPRFSKDWWGYFWEYYKVQTIALALIIIALILMINEFLTKPYYDLSVTYAADQYLSGDNMDKLEKLLSENVVDQNNDGKELLFVNKYVYSEDTQNLSWQSAMLTKFQVDFMSEDVGLFIFDLSKAKIYETSGIAEAFMPVDEWLNIEVSDEKMLKFSDKFYAVSLAESKLLNDLEINTNNLYIAVRMNNRESDILKKRIDNSKDIANHILGVK